MTFKTRSMAVVGEAAGWLVKLLARLLLHVQTEGLERIPASGPVILAINHVNFIDAPLLYTIMPRHITGLVKAELWKNPVLGLVARAWGTIPIRRGELDLDAFRRALQVLHTGNLLGLAPEGTRSHHGSLRSGRPGAVMLALRAPSTCIVPMAIYGHEHYARYWRRLRRTPVHLSFGQPFRLKQPTEAVTHATRQRMTDEIMWQIAALLPSQYRGVYADLHTATQESLDFPEETMSSLQQLLGQTVKGRAGAEAAG